MSQDDDAPTEEIPELPPLLAAASRAFALYGVRRVTLEDIATEAGVSRTTIWRALGSKRQIQEALAVARGGQTFARIRRAVPPGTSVVEALAQVSLLARQAPFEDEVAARLLEHEPESVLPAFSEPADGGPSLYFLFGDLIAQLLRERCPDVDQLALPPEAAAELALRTQLSFFFAGKSRLPDADELGRMVFAGLLRSA